MSGQAIHAWARGGLIAALALGAAGAAHAACLKSGEAGQVAEGKLIVGRFKDSANRVERAYILQLRASVCLEGSEDTDKIDRTHSIHVSATDDAVIKRIGRMVGKSVRVTGEPFGQHTAHHHAPIVMLLSEIDPL